MKKIIAFTLLASFLLLGCLGYGGQPGNPTAQPTNPPDSTASPVNVVVSVLEFPTTATIGNEVLVKWKLDSSGPLQTKHTAVHYGPESKSGQLTPKTYPGLTIIQEGNIPGEFTARIIPDSAGKIYFRAHAIVGDAHFWSDERMIEISAASPTANDVVPAAQPSASVEPSATAQAPAVQEIAVVAKKFEFSPGTSQPITVKKGVPVRLLVTVPAGDTDHGLSIPAFSVNANLPVGQTTKVEFTPDNTGTFPFSCSVFCGSGHGGMGGSLVVTD